MCKEKYVHTLYWNYLIIEVEGVLDLELYLTEYGATGWELIQIMNIDAWVFIFKRQSGV